MQNPKLSTLQFLLYQFQARVPSSRRPLARRCFPRRPWGRRGTKFSPETLKATTLVIITLPIIFIYPFFQNYIIKGMLIGSIKE